MNEETPQSIHHIRGSVILLSLRIFGILFVIDTLYAALLAGSIFSSLGVDYATITIGTLWFLHTVKFIIAIYLILTVVIRWATTTYYLTDHQLVQVGGVIKIDEKIYELGKLRSVDVSQDWLGKLLDYGTIHGTVSASGYTDQFKMVGIGEPKKYERILGQYLKAEAPTA